MELLTSGKAIKTEYSLKKKKKRKWLVLREPRS
jgi:hypothetical protein